MLYNSIISHDLKLQSMNLFCGVSSVNPIFWLFILCRFITQSAGGAYTLTTMIEVTILYFMVDYAIKQLSNKKEEQFFSLCRLITFLVLLFMIVTGYTSLRFTMLHTAYYNNLEYLYISLILILIYKRFFAEDVQKNRIYEILIILSSAIFTLFGTKFMYFYLIPLLIIGVKLLTLSFIYKDKNRKLYITLITALFVSFLSYKLFYSYLVFGSVSEGQCGANRGTLSNLLHLSNYNTALFELIHLRHPAPIYPIFFIGFLMVLSKVVDVAILFLKQRKLNLDFQSFLAIFAFTSLAVTFLESVYIATPGERYYFDGLFLFFLYFLLYGIGEVYAKIKPRYISYILIVTAISLILASVKYQIFKVKNIDGYKYVASKNDKYKFAGEALFGFNKCLDSYVATGLLKNGIFIANFWYNKALISPFSKYSYDQFAIIPMQPLGEYQHYQTNIDTTLENLKSLSREVNFVALLNSTNPKDQRLNMDVAAQKQLILKNFSVKEKLICTQKLFNSKTSSLVDGELYLDIYVLKKSL